ncbi:zinc finger, CCHC-type containing protein [Tanacetum coccineum]
MISIPSSSKIAEDEVEGTRDKTLSQREYCFIIEEDPRTLSEAMDSRDVAFWKEAVNKFDASGKGVIICLYVDDMLIFGTDQDQVNKTKEFLSSNFDMKDLGEAEILTKFNFANCSPVYTPVDLTMKFPPNKGTLVSQLEYSRAIGCLMYAMISTRPDIAFAVGKLIE